MFTRNHFDQLIVDQAFRMYPPPVNDDGQPYDDWGYAQTERAGFIAGAWFTYELLQHTSKD